MKRKIAFRLLMPIAILFTASFVVVSQQEERIIRFHSDIRIETDGRIEVAEHIRVYAGGEEIKRGIVREIPLFREDNAGKRVSMNYKVLEVKCDGNNAKFRTADENGYLAIYIGDANVLLNAGEYDYTIRYESYGHIGFFDDYDELYWNVTGNDWIFPIESASATVTLPLDEQALSTDFYTVKRGAKGKDCTVENDGNRQTFTATRRLEPREGLTISVTFRRDVVARPSAAALFWNRNFFKIIGFVFLLIALCYFCYDIFTAGKRPYKPVVIPTFSPPCDMSPASVRYLSTKKCDNKAFAATLINLAVKGVISIRCNAKKQYTLITKWAYGAMNNEEKKTHDAVFKGNPYSINKGQIATSVEVNSKNHEKFFCAHCDLIKSMKSQWDLNHFFRNNEKNVYRGWLIIEMLILLYLLLTGKTCDPSLACYLASPILVYGFIIMLRGTEETVNRWLGYLLAAIIVYYVMFVGAAYEDVVNSFWFSALFLALMPSIYMLYAKRMMIFTPEGAVIASEIEGLTMYMKTAEEHRLNMLNPPEKTPELFEKLLPYAFVLDLTNEWCEKFGDVLNSAKYNPEWYNGDFNDGFTAAAFAVALGKSFETAVGNVKADTSSSSSSSSSGSSDWSSGSSGGGYSGGGGGGGGGRGW